MASVLSVSRRQPTLVKCFQMASFFESLYLCFSYLRDTTGSIITITIIFSSRLRLNFSTEDIELAKVRNLNKWNYYLLLLSHTSLGPNTNQNILAFIEMEQCT